MSVSLVQEVVKKGINYIDTAPWYGQGRSEEVLGKAFKYALKINLNLTQSLDCLELFLVNHSTLRPKLEDMN